MSYLGSELGVVEGRRKKGEEMRFVLKGKDIHRFRAIFDFEKLKKIWNEGALAHDDAIRIFYIMKKDDGEDKVQTRLVEKD